MPYRYMKWMFMVTIIVIATIGCGQTKQEAAKLPQTQSPTPAVQTETPPAVMKSEIKVYYGDSNAEKVIEKQNSISYGTAAEKYAAVMHLIQQNPGEGAVSLWESIKINSIKYVDGQITIDITIPDQARLGSAGEDLMLSSLEKTLFQFTELQSIEILVDGQQTESLMGHAELPHPIKRSAT